MRCRPRRPEPADPVLLDHVAGGLFGLAAGDALGAAFGELHASDDLHALDAAGHEELHEILARWQPAATGASTALATAIARAYVQGFSTARVTGGFATWYESLPRDLDAMAEAAVAFGLGARASCAPLARSVATGLVRRDAWRRRAEAEAVCRITHADPSCVEACVVYCDLAHLLVEGVAPRDAVAQVRDREDRDPFVGEVLAVAPDLDVPELEVGRLDVLSTLGVAVWAVCQPRPLADVLVDVVDLAPASAVVGATAGALLGARDGLHAIPTPWLARLDRQDELLDLVPALAATRGTDTRLSLRARLSRSHRHERKAG